MDVVTLQAAKAEDRKIRRRLLIPLATRGAPSFGTTGALSDGVVIGGTSRYQHTALATVHSVVLAFSNFYNNNGTETDTPNAITVRASVEPANTRTFPVFFGGQRDVTIQPGATVFSDPVTIDVAKGSTFWSRTFVAVAQAGQFFPSGSFIAIAANGEGSEYSATPTDKTTAGTVTTGASRAFGPSAVLGYPKTPGSAVIGIVGDSLAAGAGETGTNIDSGFIVRALAGNYPFQKVAYPSELVDGWMQLQGATRWRRASLLARCGITHIVCELGINSISNAQVQAHLLAVWQFLADFGVPVFQTTITPKTTSTDGWVTTGNQTVTANEAARVSLNTYIRTVPSPLSGIFEIADLVETGRNSGIWKAGYTDDGTHPNSTGHAAAAPGITPSTFGAAAS